MKISTVIFDLDGTLINSEKAWGVSFVKVLEHLKIKSTSDHPQVGGVSLSGNWKMILERDNIKTEKTVDELVKLTINEFRKQIDNIDLQVGALEFLEWLKEREIKITLATSTDRDDTLMIINKLKIINFFEFIITGSDVKNKKPDPEIFLKTIESLSLSKDECLVVEDSPSGINAAKSAGIKVVGIVWEKNYPKEINQADFVVKSFTEIKSFI